MQAVMGWLGKGGYPMRALTVNTVILLLLLAAMVYGATMAVTYWTGINV